MYLERRETYTVEEAIDRIGYGAFQMKLMFVIGLAWVRPHFHRHPHHHHHHDRLVVIYSIVVVCILLSLT